MFTLPVDGKPVRVSLTAPAARSAALVVDREPYFSCLIRKRVHFSDGAPASTSDRIELRFSPVVARQCRTDTAQETHRDLVSLPAARCAAFVPAWPRLDFARGDWRGEFGLTPEET